ncbi:MAG: VOC family protein [Chloroflexota bacterium]|nr:VOC family protein [Chloroflexota bacterium]
MTVQPTPHVTAYLCAKGAAEAIAFYKKAFGAEERHRMADDDGRIGHAEITIGDTTLFISDEWQEYRVLSPLTLKGSSVSFVLDVADCDAAFQRAIDAGAKVERPLKDEPYGRGGWIVDPFGHRWSIMTANSDFNPDDMK